MLRFLRAVAGRRGCLLVLEVGRSLLSRLGDGPVEAACRADVYLRPKEIADRLYLSPRTVERHIANLANKAGVQRRSQLVAFAARATGAGTPSS